MARAGQGQMQQYIQQETQKQQMQVWSKCPFSLNYNLKALDFRGAWRWHRFIMLIRSGHRSPDFYLSARLNRLWISTVNAKRL